MVYSGACLTHVKCVTCNVYRRPVTSDTYLLTYLLT